MTGRLLVATRSVDKLAEIRELLAGVPDLEVLSPDDLGLERLPEEATIERYETFEENARAKAMHFHARAGLPTVADDSGLMVDALDGRPGVRSKRFAPGATRGDARDQANNEHLLRLLEGIGPARRGARYVCVAVFVEEGEEPRAFRGEVEGRILEAPQGRGGFGYDPLFFHPRLGRTYAEVPREEKARSSHRGSAFRSFAAFLREREEGG